jgi:glycosyltransferase involved in cell wall biosynthesis
MKVLITVPDLKQPGGVASLFRILKMEYFFQNVSLFTMHNKTPFLIRLPYKYLIFFFKLIKYDIIHFNPSLAPRSFYRDSIFVLMALLLKKKVIVYWHGWEEDFEKKIKNNYWLHLVTKKSFLKADTTIVLGAIFKEKLLQLGGKNQILIETNAADNNYITKRSQNVIHPKQLINIIFLSRIEKKKGVYIAIETINILNMNGDKFRLIIAGTGSEENNVKLLIKDNKSIEWAGYVDGVDKHNLLTKSHIMLFPSYYSEGLPITILEAMMYGLPIVSRPVGGLSDIAKNNLNGLLIESLQPQSFADGILKIINDPVLYKQMSELNIKTSYGFTPYELRKRMYEYYEATHLN